jgi:hypothetical protein
VCRKQTIEKLLLFFLKANGKSKSALPPSGALTDNNSHHQQRQPVCNVFNAQLRKKAIAKNRCLFDGVPSIVVYAHTLHHAHHWGVNRLLRRFTRA